MKIKSIILIGISAALAALPSCKKDDETSSSKEYLDGSLSFSMPQYVTKGEAFSLTPKGVTHPATGLAEDVGYYWTNSWTTGQDTTKTETDPKADGTYSFVTPSQVGTFTVSCVAYATDYYTISAVVSFSVVDPALDSTIAGAYSKSDPKFIDPRDGKSYYTTSFNGKTWLKNNLYHSGSGVSYENSEAMDPIYGRYYLWDEAVKACPEGWHLPSGEEFAEMANALANEGTEFSKDETFTGVAGGVMVDAKFFGSRMWEFWPDVKITNKTGLSVLPVGYVIDSGDTHKFTGTDNYAAFWTSDSKDDNLGVYRYIYVKQNDILLGSGDKKSFRASVRCVKD